MADADLRDIQATLSGDGQAYGRLVRRHQDQIAGRMWRFTRDRRQLEELVHNVFVETYLSLRGFRGAGPFVHWLNRIATRIGYQYWRSLRRPAGRQLPLQDWDAIQAAGHDSAIEAEEAAEALHNLLAQLRPRDRLVLTLMYLEELSVAQISRRTGWSKTMVKVQAHRARKKLRALVDKTGTERGNGIVINPETKP